METLIILVVTLTCMFFMTYYLCGRDLLAPPVIMTGMFIIGSMFALLNSIEWEIDYSWKAYALIVTGIVAFDVPFFVHYQNSLRFQHKSETCKTRIIHIEKWKIILTILTDLLLLIVYCQSVNSLVRAGGYSGANVQLYFRNVTGYEGTESLNTVIKQLVKIIDVTAYIFTFVFVNNVVTYKFKRKKYLVYLLPAVMFVLKAFLSGGRQDMLRIIAFFVIVTYILNCQKVGWNKNISIKYICIIVTAFMIVLPAFYYALSLAGRSTTRTMFQMISTYIGGPIQHFNQYIQEPSNPGKYWGTETFTPILNLLNALGVIEFHETIHLEVRRLGITSGNVYTFFRRPLHDFGLIGMYLFTMLISIFFSRMYFFWIKYKAPSYNTDFHIIIYAYFMYWIVLSSIDQLAMSYISVYTLVTLMLMYLMWKFYIYTEFNGCKIIIHKNSN